MKVQPAPPAPPVEEEDRRFRDLVGPAWARLPAPVRKRFGTKARAGETLVYAGEIVECRRTRVGRLVVELSRLIGAPLPLFANTGVAALVSVMDDGDGGQFWTRAYMRRAGFPQVIRSRKRFEGPTGLEEWVGGGLGVALDVSADAQALHFRSRFYFVKLGRRRWRLPRWSAPGQLAVAHIDRADGGFAFTLTLSHSWFGEILSQTAVFHQRS